MHFLTAKTFFAYASLCNVLRTPCTTVSAFESHICCRSSALFLFTQAFLPQQLLWMKFIKVQNLMATITIVISETCLNILHLLTYDHDILGDE